MMMIMFDSSMPVLNRGVPHEVHSFSTGSAKTVFLVSLYAYPVFLKYDCFSSIQCIYQGSHNDCNLHKTANIYHTPDFKDASDPDTDLMSLEDSACEDHETDSVGTGRNGNGATQIVRMAP